MQKMYYIARNRIITRYSQPTGLCPTIAQMDVPSGCMTQRWELLSTPTCVQATIHKKHLHAANDHCFLQCITLEMQSVARVALSALRQQRG